VEELPVLVVGAGPVGLALAVVLEHHGVACRIIDRADTPARLSKASGIQARTLEIFDELRLSGQLLDRGMRITTAEVRSHGEVTARLDYDAIASDSRYPFMLGLPQSTTEAILTERLAERGVVVERGVELGECRQRDRGVTAILRDRDGSCETVKARWIAGCDGPSSTVRAALRIPHSGDEHRTSYALGDFEASSDLPHETAMLLLEDHGAMQLLPIAPERWRIAVECGPIRDFGRPPPPTTADLQRFCDRFLPERARVRDVHWSTYYCVRHRRASPFRSGRAFLLGDAASVHSPMTLQGMNAGIQDAWNLGWKLALAERGAATEELLDSYDAERRDIDVRMTQSGGPVQRLIAVDDAPTRRANGVVRSFLASLPGYERHIGLRTALASHGYRSSPAVEQRGSMPTKARSGDLAPDAPFTTDAGVRIRDGRSYVSLLFTGDADRSDPRGPVDIPRPARLPIRSVLVTREPGVRAPRSGTSLVLDSGGGIHHAWGITRPTHVLVRPDGHIGWRSEPPDVPAFTRYRTRLHGTMPPDRPPVSGAARQERLAG
jgi:2-polyprenyl-6-methoxyphenol hydroxylase-like FAD-dependent oxidoreductase